MSTPRDEQKKLWNNPSGHAWVELQALLDQTFAPIETLLVDAVAAVSPARVLDIGCGTGATTLAVARQIAPKDGCVGVDISEPMIAAARARAERERLPATFICANAQEHPFDPGRVDEWIRHLCADRGRGESKGGDVERSGGRSPRVPERQRHVPAIPPEAGGPLRCHGRGADRACRRLLTGSADDVI